ncbi:hypothetical protein P5673_003697, partial [Acropora cervicornis]
DCWLVFMLSPWSYCGRGYTSACPVALFTVVIPWRICEETSICNSILLSEKRLQCARNESACGKEGTIGVVDDFDPLIELVNKTGELWAFGKELETVSEVTESDIEIVVALGFGVYTSVDVTNMFDEVAKSVDVLTDTVDVHSDDVVSCASDVLRMMMIFMVMRHTYFKMDPLRASDGNRGAAIDDRLLSYPEEITGSWRRSSHCKQTRKDV